VSSAAATAADAFCQLAGLVHDDIMARAYADYAVQILVRLAHDDFLAFDGADGEGVLKHATYTDDDGLCRSYSGSSLTGRVHTVATSE